MQFLKSEAYPDIGISLNVHVRSVFCKTTVWVISVYFRSMDTQAMDVKFPAALHLRGNFVIKGHLYQRRDLNNVFDTLAHNSITLSAHFKPNPLYYKTIDSIVSY